MNSSSSLLASELASPWRCPLLGGGLPSAGLRLLPLVMNMTSLERKAGFQPRCGRPQGNRHHGLSGQSVLHPEVVGDELEVPKVNGFTEEESTTHQTFTINSDGDHR
jgi:hypothetical protein